MQPHPGPVLSAPGVVPHIVEAFLPLVCNPSFVFISPDPVMWLSPLLASYGHKFAETTVRLVFVDFNRGLINFLFQIIKKTTGQVQAD